MNTDALSKQELPTYILRGLEPYLSYRTSAILAFGAWLKNTACLLEGGSVWWSPVHGDLGTPDSRSALQASVNALCQQASRPIAAVAHDLHPDFYSTELAVQLAAELGVPALAVQHHHAHIAAVLAEHGVDKPVIGLALDGVGLGTDGMAWGGEVLWVDGAQCERVGHLAPLALPGGDTAAQEPWRMALAALAACGQIDQAHRLLDAAVGAPAVSTVQTMLQRQLNCPISTSAGRWFDAAAGLLGLSVRQAFEAQAAMALEQAATRYLDAHPEGVVVDPAHWRIQANGVIDLTPLMASWIEHLPMADRDVELAAAHFHCTLADALAAHAMAVAQLRSADTVALGGGCFFNRILKHRIVTQLEGAGLRVLLPLQTSCGDSGLALGQAWVAAHHVAACTHQTVASNRFHSNNKVTSSCV